MLRMLLDRGVDVDGEADNGGTPLLFAAAGGQPQAVDILIARGASLDLRDRTQGWPPLVWAVEGANRVLRARRARSAASFVAAAGDLPDYVQVVRSLVRAGAVVEATNREGRTALDLARRYGLYDLVLAVESAARDRANVAE